MNRSIKFRVWDGFNRCMIYPAHDLRLQHDSSYFLKQGLQTPQQGQQFGYGRDLMAFIGIQDSEKRDVYEGDIVEWREKGDATPRAAAAIRYLESICGYSLYVPNTKYRTDFQFVDLTSLRIIGNIFENPALLNA